MQRNVQLAVLEIHTYYVRSHWRQTVQGAPFGAGRRDEGMLVSFAHIVPMQRDVVKWVSQQVVRGIRQVRLPCGHRLGARLGRVGQASDALCTPALGA